MITATDIDFSFRANRQVLHQVSTELRGGQFMAILGNNGVGKSTFMYCLNRILQPDAGQVQVGPEGELRDIRNLKRGEIAREIAFVAQHSHANRLTVFDSVLLGRKPHINLAPTKQDLAIVDDAISRLGLTELSLRYVDELSGGEYQKVILARALAQDTGLLLLDEPTNNLDPYNQYEVMRIVRDVVDEDGIAAVAVMHDLNLAVRYCDTFMFLKDGAVYAHGGVETVTPKTLKDVYGIESDVINHNGYVVIITH
ncbi:MAG TPA: ABC transporter ATP-binding protein [Actinomycetaceae bacterium]|nr:ABC transporter ATP-binding protein [Actinomycetaceae bacterium]